MFDPKKFTVVPTTPDNLFGPVGRGDVGEEFQQIFKAKQCGVVTVIGRRDGGPGAFTIKGDELAFYEFETPRLIWDKIKCGEGVEGEYFPIDHSCKYIYLQLVKIMSEREVEWR